MKHGVAQIDTSLVVSIWASSPFILINLIIVFVILFLANQIKSLLTLLTERYYILTKNLIFLKQARKFLLKTSYS